MLVSLPTTEDPILQEPSRVLLTNARVERSLVSEGLAGQAAGQGLDPVAVGVAVQPSV